MEEKVTTMKAWNDDGKTYTKEYQDAYWDMIWTLHKQKAKLDATLLAVSANGEAGASKALDELEKTKKVLYAYKKLIMLTQQEKTEKE